MRPIELWAGAECTLNRVGDVYFDQLERTGHLGRLQDLDRLAQLGVRRVRFPVSWERCAPERGRAPDFRWCDARLERLASLGIEPIVGLVHHGSGPLHTSLCEESFAPGLAAFAEQVARRYPWVSAYTPVNEPLTTARFACLYGLWYPHQRQLAAFVRALMHQVLAIRASMAAIRSVNPRAALYQTEDLGQTFSTPDLEEQCRYERQRRWLSLDLLFGRVAADHPLRQHLEQHGADPRCLDQWCAEPCPPDLVGVNYYATSDRFLDSRLERYPRETWGGNGRQEYADVEAVRARHEGISGHAAILQEVSERYRAPCALTEVHLACQREEQLRWLYEAWQGAQAARAAGADVRAVTLWSAFGAVGWNNLVTRASGEYEPGAYDIRAPEPRPTALARLAQSLARGDAPDTLALAAGWWRHSTRFAGCQLEAPAQARPRVLVLGADGFACRVAAVCSRRFDCATAATVDAARALLSAGARSEEQPIWAIILAPDPAGEALILERDTQLGPQPTHSSCVVPPRVLAFSSSCIFDGWSARPYLESDMPCAGGARAEGWCTLEHELTRSCPATLIVRCGLAIDPDLPDDPIAAALEELRVGHAPRLPAWQWVSPTYLPQFIGAALDLLVDGERGIWHLTPRSSCSVLELTRRMATRLGLAFHAQATPSSRRGAQGPMRALASERGWPLPDLDDTLEAYARHLESHSRWSSHRQRSGMPEAPRARLA
jgi:dTDP-4-dehydrorhamnose reductase